MIPRFAQFAFCVKITNPQSEISCFIDFEVLITAIVWLLYHKISWSNDFLDIESKPFYTPTMNGKAK